MDNDMATVAWEDRHNGRVLELLLAEYDRVQAILVPIHASGESTIPASEIDALNDYGALIGKLAQDRGIRIFGR